MRGLLTSVRYTIRLLLKSPTFTIIAVLILGVGIGANTAIFSLLNAVVLNPLPFPHPDRLVSVVNTTKEISHLSVDLPDYVDSRAVQQSFDEIAVARETFLDLSDSAGPQRLNAGFVSASLFTVTGRPFVIGRPFTDVEDTFGGPLLVILTERFWRSHFQSDPNVLGKNVTLSGRSYEIIGVCPTQVDDWGVDSPDLYVPVQGAGIGWCVALGLIGLIKEVGLQESLTRVDGVAFDGATLTFFAGITGLVSLLTGSLSALKAATAGTGLKDLPNRTDTAGRQRQRTQRILVIGQVALSCVLLTAAALLVRSFLAAQSQPLGFNPEHLVAAEVSLTSRKYDDLAKIRQFFDAVLERIRQLRASPRCVWTMIYRSYSNGETLIRFFYRENRGLNRDARRP